MHGYNQRDREMNRGMKKIPPVSFSTPSYIPKNSTEETSRTLKLTGFDRYTTSEQIKAFAGQFGAINIVKNQLLENDYALVTYFDVRDTNSAKNKIKNTRYNERVIYCESVADPDIYCDTVLLQPKVKTRFTPIDQIKNELMSFGEVNNFRTSNGGYLIQFYDCRVPKAVVSNGPFLINSVIFTPSFSAFDENNDLRFLGEVTGRKNILSKEKVLELVKFIKTKAQK